MKKNQIYLNNYINYLNRDLNEQRKLVLVMFDKIIYQYKLVYESLREKEQLKSKQVIENDAEINNSYSKFLNLTIWKITKRQFVTRDLRQVIIFLIIFHELEIIADYATNIARYFVDYPNSVKLFKNYLNEGFIHLLSMLGYIKKIIETANLNLTYLIPKFENKLNLYYKQETKTLFDKLRDNNFVSNPENIYLILKQLKYIDQATQHLVNISELLIYIKEGKFFDLSDYSNA